jgi:hypothetical protein
MVNASMVNGRVLCFPRATFCDSFPVFGRFPRFQNPVKYSRNFNINHDLVHFALDSAARHPAFFQQEQ